MVALYDKIAELSMESLIKTNSGKLVSVFSSDIYSIERGLYMSPTAFAAPFINIFCIILIGIILGWWYSLGLVISFFFIIIIFHIQNNLLRKVKTQETVINDNRIKLINDMVIGIRTIKCYAWELLYLDKINA